MKSKRRRVICYMTKNGNTGKPLALIDNKINLSDNELIKWYKANRFHEYPLTVAYVDVLTVSDYDKTCEE